MYVALSHVRLPEPRLSPVSLTSNEYIDVDGKRKDNLPRIQSWILLLYGSPLRSFLLPPLYVVTAQKRHLFGLCWNENKNAMVENKRLSWKQKGDDLTPTIFKYDFQTTSLYNTLMAML